MSLSFWITALLVLSWASFSVLKFYIKNTTEENRLQLLQDLGPAAANIDQPLFLGFFHPYWYVHTFMCKCLVNTLWIYSNAGGGGERVLWTALRDVQRDFSNVICVVYTGDIEATKEQIINKVKVVVSSFLLLRRPTHFIMPMTSIDQFQHFAKP